MKLLLLLILLALSGCCGKDRIDDVDCIVCHGPWMIPTGVSCDWGKK